MANVGIGSDFPAEEINPRGETTKALRAWEKKKGIKPMYAKGLDRVKVLYRKWKEGSMSPATVAAVLKNNGKTFAIWDKTGVPA